MREPFSRQFPVRQTLRLWACSETKAKSPIWLGNYIFCCSVHQGDSLLCSTSTAIIAFHPTPPKIPTSRCADTLSQSLAHLTSRLGGPPDGETVGFMKDRGAAVR